ncbi:MAG: hypothetical protein GY835_00895 [bacterium]|nr:hypothetical protein [bacterium]
MKRISQSTKLVLMTQMILAALLLLSGCEQTTPVQDPPDSRTAASLAVVSRTPATVEDNLALQTMFDTPMSMATGESGLYGDIEGDAWTSESISIPEISALNSLAFSAIGTFRGSTAGAVRGKGKFVEEPHFAQVETRADPAPGDTLFVNHFPGNPLVDGLDALIYVDPPHRLRFVSLRNHPDAPAILPTRSLVEVVFDTNGTPLNPLDDIHFSLHAEEEWANGQRITGDLASETPGEPIAADGVAVALHRTENPMFNPLQSWRETEVRLVIGSLDTDEDDAMHSLRCTVHWLSGAELTTQVNEVDDGPIMDEVTVDVSATFTAAPANAWLEMVVDTLRMQLGVQADGSDDLLESISRESTFDGVDMNGDNPRSIVSFTPAEPVGNGQEPDAGVFEQLVFYPVDWWLLRLDRTLTINADGSGSLDAEMLFRDGSTFTRHVTWDGAGNATLTEERPGGVVVSGTWNESDGEFNVTTTFAAGHDPISRVQSRIFSEGAYEFSDEFIWLDGHTDLSTFSVTGDEDNFTIVGHSERGDVIEDFTLSGRPGALEGDWSRNDGASGSFELDELEGGGSHLLFTAVESDEEGDCSIAGEIWFAPDGSGHGTVDVTENGVTITLTIEFGPDGTGLLHDSEGNEYPLS